MTKSKGRVWVSDAPYPRDELVWAVPLLSGFVCSEDNVALKKMVLLPRRSLNDKWVFFLLVAAHAACFLRTASAPVVAGVAAGVSVAAAVVAAVGIVSGVGDVVAAMGGILVVVLVVEMADIAFAGFPFHLYVVSGNSIVVILP